MTHPVLQSEARQRDAATSILGSLAEYYGERPDVGTLRRLLDPGRPPFTLLDLRNAAERAGFSARGVRGTFEQFRTVPLPAVVHLTVLGGSFAVVTAMAGDFVYLAVPPRPVLPMSVEEFRRIWSGLAVLVERAAPARLPAPESKALSLAGLPVLVLADGSRSRETTQSVEKALRTAGANVSVVEMGNGHGPLTERTVADALLEHCPSWVTLLTRDPACADAIRRSGLPVLNLVEDAENDGDRRIQAGVERVRSFLGQCRAFEDRVEPPAASLALSREQFVDYLTSTCPPLLVTKPAVEALLNQADGLDAPSWKVQEGRVYHRCSSWNWLFNRSARFHEMEARARRTTRERADLVPERRVGDRCCGERPAGSPERVLVRPQRFRATVTCDIDVSAMDPGTPLRVYLPVPLSTDAQTEVRIVRCEPASLGAGLSPEFGFIYGSELRVGASSRLAASFTAEWTGYEIHSHGWTPTRPRAPDVPLEALLSDLQQGGAEPLTKAWILYDWMLSRGRFEKSWNPCLCSACCAHDFVRDQAGHCIVLAHAFIAYCETVGVKARPVRGVMFTHPRDAQGSRFGLRVPGEPAIGHTWVEVEAPGIGWLPVEFHAIVFKSTNEGNCYDPMLRRRLADDSEFLRTFYFGNLDNQRMVCTRSVLQTPPALYYDPAQERSERWRPVPMSRMTTDVEFEYR